MSELSHRLCALVMVIIVVGMWNLPAVMAAEEDSVRMDAVWVPDNGDGTYTNPVLYADYSDPDIVMVGEDFYMVSSSFNCVPGVPVLHSKDLVNWDIIGHVFHDMPPDSVYDDPGHGVGVWAPSIRYHNGEFYVCYADPDYGIYMGKATDPAGPWEHKLVQESYGWIDPCPFWDDNDSAYLVHAYAKSRIGFNSILTLRRMSSDGEHISLTDTIVLFDGNDPAHPRKTIEGPKMYKRNGYYYVFAPFNGVRDGSQAVLRSDSIFGPYQDSTVLERGSTDINGPHQGGWVELPSGESWFMHFQEKLPYGRIVHLEPLEWIDDWPFIGKDLDGNGIGEPVATYAKPDVGQSYPVTNPRTSDIFDGAALGLQWQWHSNFDSTWWSLTDHPGSLRLNAALRPDDYINLWDVGSMVLQKLPAERFSVTTKVKSGLKPGEEAGLLFMAIGYTWVGIVQTDTGLVVTQRYCTDAENGSKETTPRGGELSLDADSVYLRASLDKGGICRLSYSENGIDYQSIGRTRTVVEGKWIGVKMGLFCQRPAENNSDQGYADFEWFSVDDYYNRLPDASGNPDPADWDSVTVTQGFTLSWTADEVFSDSFDIYLDTVEDPVVKIGTAKKTEFEPAGLEAGTNYFWRVDARNDKGITPGPVWSFYVRDVQTSLPQHPFSATELEVRESPVPGMASLEFTLPGPAEVRFTLVNLSGAIVREIARGDFQAGSQTLPFSTAGLANGLYLIRMDTPAATVTRKILVR